MGTPYFCEVIGDLVRVADAMRIRPALRAGRCDFSNAEVAEAGCAERRIVAIWYPDNRVLVGPQIITEVFRIEPIEAKTQLIQHRRRKWKIVPDNRMWVAALRPPTPNLDERCPRRLSRQVTPLIGFAAEEAVLFGELIVSLDIELMVVVGLDRICLVVVADAGLVGRRRPNLVTRHHIR